MSTARRVYLYLVMLLGLGLLAAGAHQFLALGLDLLIKGSAVTEIGGADYVRQQLSLSLALIIIGAPLWFFFWRMIQRAVARDPAEAGTALRKIILTLVLITAALAALFGAARFLEWLLSGAVSTDFAGLTPMIVAGIIWAYFWYTSEKENQPTPVAHTARRWYLYVISGWGLFWLAMGLVNLVSAAITSLPFFEATLISGPFWAPPVPGAVAGIIVGALYLVFHWRLASRDNPDATLRQVYIYLLAIVGGAIAGLTALITIIAQTLTWGFDPAVAPAGEHFRFLGWTIPTLVVGAAVWFYHREVAREEAGQLPLRRLSAQRIHYYIMSFLGLAAMSTGVALLIGLLISLAAPGTVLAEGAWWQSQLSLALALLIVAAPIWFYYWGQILERTAAGGVTESKARSRRIYLYTVTGISMAALAAALVNIIYQALTNLLGTGENVNFLENLRWSLQGLVVAAPLLWYHWQTIRRDGRRGAEAAARQKSVTVILSREATELLPRIEEKLGYKVRVLYSLNPPQPLPTLAEEDLDYLATMVAAAGDQKVMVILTPGRLLVLPYQEK
jgi:ABC-type multidrug transport system fused ATPase/permease subunit